MRKKRPELERLGEALKASREKAGLTQQELAEACGWTSKSSYNPYESGLKDPSFSVLLRIAHAIGVSLKEFDQPAG